MYRLRPVVLCYHAVSENWPNPLAVTLSSLERQLRFLLACGLRSAPAADIVRGGPKLLHVTFDDAFTSIERAVPILERLRVHATVFACSGLADEGSRLEVPELAEDVARHPDELVTMTWDGLRALNERGVEVGSHSVSHMHLLRLSDEELNHELRESRERVEEELRQRCLFLAYPFGEHDRRVREAARVAGYQAAFALPGHPRWHDAYAISRVAVARNDGFVRMALKISVVGRTIKAYWS